MSRAALGPSLSPGTSLRCALGSAGARLKLLAGPGRGSCPGRGLPLPAGCARAVPPGGVRGCGSALAAHWAAFGGVSHAGASAAAGLGRGGR